MAQIYGRKQARLFIREWIEFKKLDQRRVAERMDIKDGTVSKLINGHMQMTLTWLAGFADALDVEITDLFRDPNRPTQQDLLSGLNEEKRQQAEDYLKYLAATGTDS